MFKISEEFKVLNLLSSTTVTGDKVTTTGVDVEVYEADALVVLQVGSISSTGATFAINVTGSTSVSGVYSDIGTFTTFTASGADKVSAIPIVLNDNSKFVKLDIDTTANGGTVGAIIGATVLVRPQVAKSGLNSATLA